MIDKVIKAYNIDPTDPESNPSINGERKACIGIGECTSQDLKPGQLDARGMPNHWAISIFSINPIQWHAI